MEITNRDGIMPVLYQAILDREAAYQSTHDQPSDISVTSLIKPPQMRYLEHEHADRLSQDASQMIYSLMGSLIHSMLETSTELPGWRYEERLYGDYANWRVSGQYDAYDEVDKTLWDFKYCSVWESLKGEPKPEWVEQLNYLRVLAVDNGMKVDTLRVQGIYRDWSKGKANSSGYPQAQQEEIFIPTWDLDEARVRMIERVTEHQQALAGNPRECTAAEMWEKPTIWAVHKTGRKSAINGGLHSSVADAEGHLASLDANHYIDVRQGERTRCEQYCAVADFCPQRNQS